MSESMEMKLNNFTSITQDIIKEQLIISNKSHLLRY